MALSTGPQTLFLAASLALPACSYPVNLDDTAGSSPDAGTIGSTAGPTTDPTTTGPTTTGPTTTGPTTTGPTTSDPTTSDPTTTGPTSASSTFDGTSEGGETTSTDGDGVHSTMPLDPDVCITPSVACDNACRANCGEPGEVCEGQVLVMSLIAPGDADEVSVSDMLITPEGDIVVAGRYVGAPDLGLGPLPNVDGGGLFVLRHDPNGKPIAQGSFAYDAWPELLRTMDGKLLTVSSDGGDTKIHEFTATPALELRDILIGTVYAATAASTRNAIYFVGRGCDAFGGLLIGRYDGEEATVVFCASTPSADEPNNMVGVAELPSGDVVLAGNISSSIPDLGIVYPKGEVANAAFLLTIEPTFVPGGVTPIQHSMLLAEPGSPPGDGVELGSLLWSGKYLISDMQASGHITTGFNEPFMADYASDHLAAFTPDLEGVGVVPTGVWGVYETAVDCAGNVLASVALRIDDDAPPFGLTTTKEFALAVVKLRSDAQTPLDPTPLWAFVDSATNTAAEDQSFASAIATSADRILLGGYYHGGPVQLPSLPPLPALAEPQSAPFLLELTP